jgi:hypothetical protein
MTTQNINARYIIEIYDTSGKMVADLSGRASLDSLIIERDESGSCQFTLDLFSFEKYALSMNLNPLDILAVNKNEVRIRRYNKYLFGGQISHIDPGAESGTNNIVVTALGWFNYLKYRLIGTAGAVFSATDAAQIAWSLINTSQGLTNGNIGITSGTLTASVNRDRTYAPYKNIHDAIVELSQVINGFDFEVTWDRVFNVYYPSQGADHTADLVFEYPGNIKKLHSPIDGAQMSNDVFATGNAIVEERSDTVFGANYGLRQSQPNYPDVTETVTLDQYGDSELASFKDVLELPQVVIDGNQNPIVGAFWVGDKISLKVSELQIFKHLNNVAYRIDKIEVTSDDQEQEEITLSLSLP